MYRSPGPTRWSAGRQKPTTSTSLSVSRTRAFSRSPSRVRGRCSPGVSTRISCASGRCTMPRTTVRVVCGLSEVMTTLVPTSALVRVDLPALGRPTNDTNPLRWPPWSVVLCSAIARLVVVGPDLVVGLAGGLAGPVDRAGVDRPRLALRAAAPVAHHVVRRAGQAALAHQMLADRPHLGGLAGHPEVAGSRGPVDRRHHVG